MTNNCSKSPENTPIISRNNKLLSFAFILTLGAGFCNNIGNVLAERANETEETIHSKTPDSVSFAPYALVETLMNIEKEIGQIPKWHYHSLAQNFFSDFGQLKTHLWKQDIKVATQDIITAVLRGPGGEKRLKQLLENQRINFRFTPRSRGNDNGISILSGMEFHITLQYEGEKIYLELDNNDKQNNKQNVEGVLLREGFDIYTPSKNHKFPIVEVKTSGENVVFMTRYDAKAPSNQYELIKLIKQITGNKEKANGINGVKFPRIDFMDTGELNWIIGAETKNPDKTPAIINQSIFYNVIKIDEKGVKKSRATNAKRSGAEIILNGPLLIWVENNSQIIFGAKINTEHLTRNHKSVKQQQQKEVIIEERTVTSSPSIKQDNKVQNSEKSEVITEYYLRSILEGGRYTGKEIFETNWELFDYLFSNFEYLSDNTIRHFKRITRGYLADKKNNRLKQSWSLKAGNFQIGPTAPGNILEKQFLIPNEYINGLSPDKGFAKLFFID